MRYLGIDYGKKRIGLALSDDQGTFAFPKEMVANDSALLGKLSLLLERESVAVIVLGDTRSFSGRENPVTAEVEAFAEKLRSEFELPVEFVWEAGSSVEASRFAPKDRGHEDSAAAAIILQRYLDTKR